MKSIRADGFSYNCFMCESDQKLYFASFFYTIADSIASAFYVMVGGA